MVPVQLSFDTKKVAGKPFVMDAAPDGSSIVRSPIFANFALPGDRPTQYTPMPCSVLRFLAILTGTRC